MPYIITITDNNPQALAFVEYAKKLDFTKVSMSKEVDEIISYNDDLEEDEYGIPIKYRDEIMALSKESNRNMTRRWEAAIAKREQEQKL